MVMLSDGDPKIEDELRRRPIFWFLNRILSLKKKERGGNSSLESEPFGTK
jgi:hypothetical protein